METLLDNDEESREVEMSVKTPTGSLPQQVDRNLTKSRRRYRSKTSAQFFLIIIFKKGNRCLEVSTDASI